MLTGFNFLDFLGLVFLYFPLYCYLDSFFWCAVLEGITSSAASHQGFHSLLVKRGAGPIRARPYGAETGGTHWDQVRKNLVSLSFIPLGILTIHSAVSVRSH